MKRLGRLGAALLAVGALATLTFAGSSAGHGKKPPQGPLTDKAIMFASDGMRPDLMERYADKGIMPTFKDLMKHGVRRQERPASGVPAQHGRRVAHACHGHLAGRARVDEQHVPPHGERLRLDDQLLDQRGPPG